MSEFKNNNAGLRRKASANKGLRNPRYYRFQQCDGGFDNHLVVLVFRPKSASQFTNSP